MLPYIPSQSLRLAESNFLQEPPVHQGMGGCSQQLLLSSGAPSCLRPDRARAWTCGSRMRPTYLGRLLAVRAKFWGIVWGSVLLFILSLFLL